MRKILPLILLVLTACSASSSPQMSSQTELLERLDFTCVKEAKPLVSPESEILYQYARYQDLHNMWSGKSGDAVWQGTLPYYRIAAANGNYKANVRLQYLLETNRILVKNPIDEVLALNKTLEKQLPATAYYKLYQYLANGYGIKVKEKLGHFAYLRRAAELGSPEAQYELGEIILSVKDKPSYEFRRKLRERLLDCASKQGSADAASALGFAHQIENSFVHAVNYFHLGVKNGHKLSAHMLADGFDKNVSSKDKVDYLGVKPDIERYTRYKMIAGFLSDYDFLYPKVPDLDDIVPLPPAKLPAWDGKIAFQRWFEGPSPEKPSDELMKKLADQAGLDWQTGLPLKK